MQKSRFVSQVHPASPWHWAKLLPAPGPSCAQCREAAPRSTSAKVSCGSPDTSHWQFKGVLTWTLWLNVRSEIGWLQGLGSTGCSGTQRVCFWARDDKEQHRAEPYRCYLCSHSTSISKCCTGSTRSDFSSPLVQMSQPPVEQKYAWDFASCQQLLASRKLFVMSLVLEKCQAQLIFFNKAFGLPLLNKKGQRLGTYIES